MIFNAQSSCQARSCRTPFLPNDHAKALVRFMTSSVPPNSETESTSTRKTISTVHSPPSNLSDEDTSSSGSKHVGDENQTLLSLPFPWRINAIEPLPRVLEHDDYSGMEITPWARFVRKAYVALELNTSWWDIIFWKKWELELVQSCAFAFQRAICGLVSRSFQGKI